MRCKNARKNRYHAHGRIKWKLKGKKFSCKLTQVTRGLSMNCWMRAAFEWLLEPSTSFFMDVTHSIWWLTEAEDDIPSHQLLSWKISRGSTQIIWPVTRTDHDYRLSKSPTSYLMLFTFRETNSAIFDRDERLKHTFYYLTRTTYYNSRYTQHCLHFHCTRIARTR